MEGIGIVTSIHGERAKVKVTSGAECTGCPAKHHCHGEQPAEREITVLNTCGADVDDAVMFEAKPTQVLLSAFLVWIVPLLSMIVGYIVAERIANGWIPIASAFLFLGGAFVLLKVIDHYAAGGRSFYPSTTGFAKPSSTERIECSQRENLSE